MVYRVYVEKKEGFRHEAQALLGEIRSFLGIKSLTGLRLLNRYDVEGIDEALFRFAVRGVLAEPQVDDTYEHLPAPEGWRILAVEYLPGQFDQRADSAAQCIQIISCAERPVVQSAKVYLFEGALTNEQMAQIEKYLINPVESRKAGLSRFDTLKNEYEIPTEVETLTGLREWTDEQLAEQIAAFGLAMDEADLAFLRDYFRSEERDPTITELRMIDTYWSDHCRHTTFLTEVDDAAFEDELLQNEYDRYLAVRRELSRTKPVTLMDLATIAARYLKVKGQLPNLDESEEINACTVKVKATFEGKQEDWLLLFKNETHNHPTEIEPFGGAATCIGGAIRDPLSGRAYVYSAMRVTGAADPLTPIRETLPGKLPQRRIVTAAAAGYSSYGNQIGLATGQVDELYHPGYAAKRMEIGAVVGAVPAGNVRREQPLPGDVVILLGGRTGRDGCGGATGSSKSHNLQSLESCGAEVQKGNAPEERKIQRLFRRNDVTRLIKRCNDFGAGGVSVAIGELADGLAIDLNAVPRKYEGLDGTELAISESQERMAVVVSKADEAAFLALAAQENLEATTVARVTAEPRLTMDWNGKRIVDLSREFLSSNGAPKHIRVAPAAPGVLPVFAAGTLTERYEELAGSLRCCSRQGLSERFDSTIGAGTVLMPFGGVRQLTPAQVMAQLISDEQRRCEDCSVMAWGYNPDIAMVSPFHSAYLAVVESVSKLVAAGAAFEEVYLTLQEYFEKPLRDPRRWGKPMAALLGAFKAQMDLGVAAIGGKDSMSGSFEQLDVPPTLVSFAITCEKVRHILSPELKQAGNQVIWLKPELDAHGLPTGESLKALFARVAGLMRAGIVRAAWTPTAGGAADGIFKMCLGNGLGFAFEPSCDLAALFACAYGSFLLEVSEPVSDAQVLGTVTQEAVLSCGGEQVALAALQERYEQKLEKVFPMHATEPEGKPPVVSFEYKARPASSLRFAKPRVLIPVFPGTNCEYDSAKAIAEAGGEPEVIVIRNLSADAIRDSAQYFADRLRSAQMVFLPGGFSGGDEPDGSGKFITAFLRNGAVSEQINELLKNRDGLMCGVCNGFQALVKLGLVPFGEIREPEEDGPTLTFNLIGRHQSRLVRTRVASNQSPWLMNARVGEVFTVPVSHGEGRFVASEQLLQAMAKNGQIATQYCDLAGKPSYSIGHNPNGSAWAIEGITSPDGRVFGKMGHSERVAPGLYRNVPGQYDSGIFRSAVSYYR